MDMEAQEEFVGSNDLTQIIRGKRTKRQRSSSPYKAVTSSSSSGYGVGGEGETGVVAEEYGSSSPTTSSQVYESTEEEEEDMANCLILLAQGNGPKQSIENNGIKVENFSARKYSDVTSSATINKAGFCVYECKTCNRSFPSFQALGGHRASHKRPKPTIEEKKSTSLLVASMDDLEDCQLNKSSTDSLSLQIANTNNNSKGFHGNKPKVHECSICGSEFTSGQALGGHMRRHRANTDNQVGMSTIDSGATIDQSTINGDDQIKPRNILGFDLNLPAPEDDHHHRESKFQFTSTQQALVFSAPALVDCHY